MADNGVCGGDAFDSNNIVACADCRTRLYSTMTTVNGVLVELVRPCPNCRLRLRPRVTVPIPIVEQAAVRRRGRPTGVRGKYQSNKPRYNEAGNPVCLQCGVAIVGQRGGHGKGRPATFCADHFKTRRAVFHADS